MALLQKQGLEPRRAHATSIAIILPLSLISLIVYWLNGNLPLTQSLPFFVPALLGSAAGGRPVKEDSGAAAQAHLCRAHPLFRGSPAFWG